MEHKVFKIITTIAIVLMFCVIGVIAFACKDQLATAFGAEEKTENNATSSEVKIKITNPELILTGDTNLQGPYELVIYNADNGNRVESTKVLPCSAENELTKQFPEITNYAEATFVLGSGNYLAKLEYLFNNEFRAYNATFLSESFQTEINYPKFTLDKTNLGTEVIQYIEIASSGVSNNYVTLSMELKFAEDVTEFDNLAVGISVMFYDTSTSVCMSSLSTENAFTEARAIGTYYVVFDGYSTKVDDKYQSVDFSNYYITCPLIELTEEDIGTTKIVTFTVHKR